MDSMASFFGRFEDSCGFSCELVGRLGCALSGPDWFVNILDPFLDFVNGGPSAVERSLCVTMSSKVPPIFLS